jgi:hypothetical protein
MSADHSVHPESMVNASLHPPALTQLLEVTVQAFVWCVMLKGLSRISDLTDVTDLQSTL